MLTQQDLDKIRTDLVGRRKELFDVYQSRENDWREDQEPQVEYEEQSQLAKQAFRTEALTQREERELEDIDNALKKLETSGFGQCESCGDPIDEARIKATPWVRQCLACAEEAETGGGPATYIGRTPPLPFDLQGLSDEELGQVIADRIGQEDQLDSDQLTVTVEDGRVRVEGFVPGEYQHQLLIQLIEDRLGIFDYEDLTRQDDRLDPRGETVPPPEEQQEKEAMMEGEAPRTDTWQSTKDGRPLNPPDRFKPEK